MHKNRNLIFTSLVFVAGMQSVNVYAAAAQDCAIFQATREDLHFAARDAKKCAKTCQAFSQVANQLEFLVKNHIPHPGKLNMRPSEFDMVPWEEKAVTFCATPEVATYLNYLNTALKANHGVLYVQVPLKAAKP